MPPHAVWWVQEDKLKQQILAMREPGTAHQSEQDTKSPFAMVSTTLGWNMFSMVHSLWLNVSDVPARSADKDWELQVRTACGDTVENG